MTNSEFKVQLEKRTVAFSVSVPAGCVVEDEQLVYYGVCAECNAKHVKTEE